ncbi:hypothetical protein AB7C87_23325 [Natrarchaeobius sp. A-rgal3]|uniref:hypothetical protein n=1 Tax=Natrarchaeobius versutus TaxID=1679078 RepID=UPI00350F4E07
MRRRAFITLATVVPLAGCSGLLGGGGVDTTLDEDEVVEFSADEGAELSITVDVNEVFQPEDTDTDLERDAVTLRIDHANEGVVDTWMVEESESFELTIDTGGTHTAMVTNGVADVTIE